MTEIPKCPTCGRRPSVRFGRDPEGTYYTNSFCPDACHALADLGPAAVALLREWMATPYFETHADWQAWVQDFGPRVKALLAAAPEVKP